MFVDRKSISKTQIFFGDFTEFEISQVGLHSVSDEKL